MNERYRESRDVLLGVLDLLKDYRDSIVVIGAHAIYARVGGAGIPVEPYTIDVDLMLNPQKLSSNVPLERVLESAGLHPKSPDSVGVWVAERKLSTPKCRAVLQPNSLFVGWW